MFSAENKENNAKSPTEDKSTSKTFARRSVLKEFDPFYSSPQQNVNKPTAINEEYEDENFAADDTDLNQKLEHPEEPLLQITKSKQDFNDTAKTNVLYESFEDSHAENSTLEASEIKEVNVGNDSYDVVTYKPNEQDSVERHRKSSIMETCEKSSNIVFVNTEFDNTFDQTQNMEAFDPLANSIINQSSDPLDQDSVYEECLDTTFQDNLKIDSTEPEDEEILEIINRSFEEALDGNDVEIEDINSQDVIFEGNSVGDVASMNSDGIQEVADYIVDDDGDNQNDEKSLHENASFAIGKNISTNSANVVVEESDTDFVAAKENESKTWSIITNPANSTFDADMEQSHDSFAPGYDCEGTDDKSMDAALDQHQNTSPGKHSKDITSEATEVEVAQNVNETDNMPMDAINEKPYNEDGAIVVDTVQSSTDVNFAAKRIDFEVAHEDQQKNASFVIDGTTENPKIIISEATEVESAQNGEETDDKPMDTTFEAENEAVEASHENQPKEVSFVVEDVVQSPREISFEADDKPTGTTSGGNIEISHEEQPKENYLVVKEAEQSPEEVSFGKVVAKRTSFGIVYDDQHQNASFVIEETAKIPENLICEDTELESPQNIKKTDDKPMDTTLKGKIETVEISHEEQLKGYSSVVSEAVQSPEEVKPVEISHEEVPEDVSFVKGEVVDFESASHLEETEHTPMDTTFEGKTETSHEQKPEEASSFIKEPDLSPEELRFEAVAAKRTDLEIGCNDQHKNASFVIEDSGNKPKNLISETTELDEQPTNTTFGANIETLHEEQPRGVSFVNEEAIQSPEETRFEAVEAKQTDLQILHNDQCKNTSFVIEPTKVNPEESALHPKEPVNTTFEAKNATLDASKEDHQKVVAFDATIAQDLKNADDEPMDISFEAKIETVDTLHEDNHKANATFEKIEVTDEPMETSFVVAEAIEVHSHNQPMDVTFEANKDDSFIVEEVQKPQNVTFEDTEVKSAQETNNKPMDATFEANTEVQKPRASLNIDTCIISDEHTAESTKCAEALAQSLNQTIEVEESAIVDDIDAIDKSEDSLNNTIQAQETPEAKNSEIQEQSENEIIVQKPEATDTVVENGTEVVEVAKSDLGISNIANKVGDSKKLVSDPIESAPKPIKRLECRPNIRPLRNKTQVIDHPIIFQRPDSQALAVSNTDGNLVFELNLLQTELKRIQEDNDKKDQSILAHALNRNSAKESIRKYEHIAREYHNHMKKQSEDLKAMRKQSYEVAANLTSTEMAFSVVFKNYEKAKLAIESYKKNESMLIEEIHKVEEKLTLVDIECKAVEDQCKEDIRIVQEQADQKKEVYKQNLNKLQANVKRLKIKASSLESSLKQKTEEAKALATLCDDILKEKPSTDS